MPTINTRIALSIASIAAAAALVVGATFAFFSDTATSNNNVFAAGTLELQVDDNNEATPSASVSASIGGTNIIPGGSVNGFISLHNGGSTPIAEIILGTTQTAQVDNGDGSNLSDVLNITIGTDTDSACDTVSDLTGIVATEVGNGFSPLTLTELVNGDYDALPGLGSDYFLCLTATMQSTAGNNYQGDSVTVDFSFTGHQDVSQ